MELKVSSVLLLAACFLGGVYSLSHVEELQSQERLLLNSLGLSERPRPATGTGTGTTGGGTGSQARRRVPSALWRMFRQSETMKTPESDPCMVSEYGVRGNTIRYVQDQGKKEEEVWFGCGICCQVIFLSLNVIALPFSDKLALMTASIISSGFIIIYLKF